MMMTVRHVNKVFIACVTASSDSLSRAEVGSSSMMILGSFKNILAIARRCFWPPESLTQRSHISVSRPCGRSYMNSQRAFIIAWWRSEVCISSFWLSVANPPSSSDFVVDATSLLREELAVLLSPDMRWVLRDEGESTPWGKGKGPLVVGVCIPYTRFSLIVPSKTLGSCVRYHICQ